MKASDPRTSVDFAPVAVVRRRRRVDPAAVAAAVVVLGILAAIAKPWDMAPESTASGATSVITAPTTARSGRASVMSPAAPDLTDPVTVDAILDGLRTTDADPLTDDRWGIRTIAWMPQDLREGRQVVEPTYDGPVVPLAVTEMTPIHLLGIAAPLDATPLDVRVWGIGYDGAWHWLDIDRLPSDDPAADLLLPPPTVDGTQLQVWPPGRYRIDLLLGADIGRIDLTIQPGSPTADAPISAVPSVGPHARVAWPLTLTPGPYAVTGGIVRPLRSTMGNELGAAGAWLDRTTVATAWLPTATALGVLLPATASDPAGVLRRLVPEPSMLGPTPTSGVRFDAANAEIPFMQFDMPAPYRLEPGVYAIELTFDTPEGRRAGTWHVELRPGRLAGRPPTLLTAARRYAPYAGSDGIVLSAAGQRGADPAAAPVRSFPLAASIGCDGTPIDEIPAVLGLTHPPDAEPGAIRASLRGPGAGLGGFPLRIARAVVPGLTLLAPAREVSFSPGTYEFAVEAEDGSRTFTVCFSASPSGG